MFNVLITTFNASSGLSTVVATFNSAEEADEAVKRIEENEVVRGFRRFAERLN